MKRIKILLSVLLTLAMVFSMLPVSVFADDANEPSAEEKLERLADEAGDAADRVEKAKENIEGKGDKGDPDYVSGHKDDAEKAFSNIEGKGEEGDLDYVPGYKKEAEEAVALVDDDDDAVIKDAKDAVDNLEEALDNAADEKAQQAVIDEAVEKVEEVVGAVNDAVEKAEKVVEEAKKVKDAAEEAAKEANAANDAANEAMAKAKEAEELYKELLQEAVNSDDPQTYKELAEAENKMNTAWDAYTEKQVLADEARKAAQELAMKSDKADKEAQGNVEKAYNDAKVAQDIADGLFKAWVEAEAKMQDALEKIDDGDDVANLKELEAHRSRARAAAIKAREDAVKATQMAVDLCVMANEAIGIANDAVKAANAAAKNAKTFTAAEIKAIEDSIKEAYEKAREDAVKDAKGNTDRASSGGNPFCIHFNEDWLMSTFKTLNVTVKLVDTNGNVLDNSIEKKNSGENGLYDSIGNYKYIVTGKSDKSGEPITKLLVEINGTLYWIELLQDNIKEHLAGSSGEIQFGGKGEKFLDGIEVDKLVRKKISKIDKAKGLWGLGELEMGSLEDLYTTGGIETDYPTDEDEEENPRPGPDRERDDTPGTTVRDNRVPAGTTTIPDAQVPLANAPLTSIEDGEVPLAGLPKTGGKSAKSSIALIGSLLALAGGLILKSKSEEEEE